MPTLNLIGEDKVINHHLGILLISGDRTTLWSWTAKKRQSNIMDCPNL